MSCRTGLMQIRRHFFEGLCKKDLIYSVDDLYDELGIKDKFFDIALNYPKLSDGAITL